MIIRNETGADIALIQAVTEAAFATAEHSSGTEAAIVDGLREASALTLSLVAEEDGELLGHAAFSPVLINGKDMNWYGLGPVSVHPDHQGKGIGGALIQDGLRKLRALDANGCVVMGHPDYYPRFGFVRDDRLRFEGVPPEYFMQQVLKGKQPDGAVTYHPAFFIE